MRRLTPYIGSIAVWALCVAAVCTTVTAAPPSDDVSLPEGVRPVWDVAKAYRETTPTRERICINGLWRWQPAAKNANTVPADGWGFFKVPGCWPGITDYMQKDSQTVHMHPKWKNAKLGEVPAAWYQREMTVPAEWAGRRITVDTEYLNSFAEVYVDGKKAGEIRFPGGEVDLTNVCRPGGTHVLSVLVTALPLQAVMMSYGDTASAKEVKGSVARRGLCGDVFLASTPAGPRLTGARIETSVRKSQIAVEAAVENMKKGESYAFVGRVTDNGREVKTFKSTAFIARNDPAGRIVINEPWKPDKLWDVHTPQNQYELQLSLTNASGKVLDILPPCRFGFREFWIDGRDFYLNGSRIFLSALPLDNAQVSTAAATYEATRESLERLRTLGINFLYTHNYDCEPGSHLSFSEILRAADDLGMLVALTQPHFGQYKWDDPDADQNNGYERHAAFYTQVAGNHPSVVLYSTSHNATGYNEDMNPDMIDGVHDRRDQWSLNNVKKALRAEAIIKRLDPGRMVYHHASGNLGIMHAINFYPNFVPVQELSDWFEHWSTQGVKPVFLCEYGAPFSWDWAMYRGWYQGKREFGSAAVPWEFCLAEWNAQFFGDRAFQISDMEKKNLRWEAKQLRDGKGWHRWDYPHQLGSTDFPEREPVLARYYTDAWRALRAWGVSATSPWEHNLLFKLRPGMNRNQREALKVDWDALQRPGYSPDYQEERYERMDMAYGRSDWLPTAGATALIRNNQPLLAYIGGKANGFTSKDHNFVASETVEKQIIAINGSRSPVNCECSWTLALPKPAHGQEKTTLAPGEQKRMPIRIALPEDVRPGEYKLSAKVAFDGGQTQEDEFTIHVLPRRSQERTETSIALFDPKGETTKLLQDKGVAIRSIDATADLAASDVLIIGKSALTIDGPAPSILRVRDGLKVLVFEQTPDVLEKRLGFRVAEYGLRQVFPRIPDHPVLAGLQAEHLADWRGSATLLPPRLKYELDPKYNGAPAVNWCGLAVTRLWRCGCRGSVASALIEKPASGDFLPLVDGGFSLQYSPLIEYREGKGVVLFCQMDVTGRTETDPAGETLVQNMLRYVSTWKPAPIRTALYVGDPAGKNHLESLGIPAGSYAGGDLAPDQVLIVGSGGGKQLAGNAAKVAEWLKAGGHLLAVGLDQENANALLPFKITMKPAEHIATLFEPFGVSSPLAGVGPADVHNRDPRELPLVSAGATVFGDGVLAKAENANVVFCQLAPWQLGDHKQLNLKRTYRRASFLVTRLLANMGVAGPTPLLARFSSPADPSKPEQRWLDGLYLDKPEEWDDPYRFFRW